ncbi:hypothetical protein AB0K14_38335 [Actinosynnema sp. NPDC050801]|uniref:terpene synthase family protein n=1 Tax=unclassified Actinosynnema TaxID=2637065 RepID=UPI0033FE43BD
MDVTRSALTPSESVRYGRRCDKGENTPGYPFVLPDLRVPWPARTNPHVGSARRHAKDWAREMGMLSGFGTWSEDTFDSDDWPLFAALTHPDADREQLHRVSLWDVCLLALDDYFVAAYKDTRDPVGARVFVERLREFMPLEGATAPVPTNQVERGLADVWSRTAPDMPPNVRSRFPDHVMEFARGNLWELANNIGNHVVDPIEYLDQRRSTSGTELSTNLAAYTLGKALPAGILQSGPMSALVNAFADCVALRNDIYSYRKEIEVEHDVNNGVLALQHFLRSDLQHAVDFAHDLYNARIAEFEHIAAHLPVFFVEQSLSAAERDGVLRYVKSLKDWMAGDNQWYRMTGRYTRNRATSPRTPALGGPTGLGTAATRIASQR